MDDLVIEQHGKVLTVTLNAPPVNALTMVRYQQLTDAFEAIGKRMDVHCVVLTGAGTRGNTISVVIPGRRSLDLAASLARMDSRILNAGVMNRAAGAELTLRFREAAPPFFAHARGNTLEVVLGATPGAPVRRAVAPSQPLTVAQLLVASGTNDRGSGPV